jgi:hypothetical protein
MAGAEPTVLSGCRDRFHMMPSQVDEKMNDNINKIDHQSPRVRSPSGISYPVFKSSEQQSGNRPWSDRQEISMLPCKCESAHSSLKASRQKRYVEVESRLGD